MSRPFAPRNFGSPASNTRINGKIRAREVRVVGPDGQQIGIVPLPDALTLARQHGVDLVEIAANAVPPVCRLVDFGKYRYEQSKKDKESKKHQHANKVKEIQLSANIDPHDFGVKLSHGVDFLCEEMKVKVSLRFRGREMAHQEIGRQVVEKFVREIAPYGHPDAVPKLIGRTINVMFSPLPKNKRAKNPNQMPGGSEVESLNAEGLPEHSNPARPAAAGKPVVVRKEHASPGASFANSPFSGINLDSATAGAPPENSVNAA